MSFSIFGEDSPRGAQLPDNYLISRNSPVVVEHNVSYTRLEGQGQSQNQNHQVVVPDASRRSQNRLRSQADNKDTDSDEDARFLRLAHEALVATTAKSNMLVDPTIEDLLARLQYALLPHGNPIKRSQNIHANENGQLMIQNFYDGFPNLSNDIFTSTSNHPLNANNTGWNFLLDKDENPSAAQGHGRRQDLGQIRGTAPELRSQRDLSISDSRNTLKEVTASPLERKNKLQRKFPCPDCHMLFRRSSDLKRHGKQHLEIPANICADCGKGFARKDALKRHRGTLTCKRNAQKGLYEKNLQYLRKS